MLIFLSLCLDADLCVFTPLCFDCIVLFSFSMCLLVWSFFCRGVVLKDGDPSRVTSGEFLALVSSLTQVRMNSVFLTEGFSMFFA